MVGLVPTWCAMERGKLSLGYAQVEARRDTPLLKRGESARGHEFHYSALVKPWEDGATAYTVLNQARRAEGYAQGNLLASYIHLHLGSNPQIARNFVEACCAWVRGKKDA